MALMTKREAAVGNKPKDISYETIKNNKSLSEFLEEKQE